MLQKTALLMSAGSACLVAQPAYSQTPSQPRQTQGAEVSASDIIVTAQKRPERITDVPISITAFSGTSLSRSGTTDVLRISQVTPGLNFQPVGQLAQPVIRGIGSTGVSVGDASNVAIYIDGIYLPAEAGNFLQFFDVERIEILKGPQGTLFGRNAAGGAISITTYSPSFSPSGKIAASYGRFDDREAQIYVTGPILEDKLAANLSFDYNKNTGFRRDIGNGNKLGFAERVMTRGKLLYKLSDSTSAQLGGNFSWTSDLTTFGNQPLNGNTAIRAVRPDVLIASEPNTAALSFVPSARNRNYGANLRIETEGPGFSVSSITAYSRNYNFVDTDSDVTPLNANRATVHYTERVFTQEINLRSSSMAPLSWITGFYYFRNRGYWDIDSYSGVAPDYTIVRRAFYSTNRLSAESYAAFAEFNYNISDRLTAILGGRYTIDSAEYIGTSQNGAGVLTATVAPKAKFSAPSWRASLRYALNTDINSYVSYSRGFKAGAFNSASLQTTPVDPEKVDAIEVGVKGRLSSDFSFDAAAFYSLYRDQQVNSFGETSLIVTLQNVAGVSKIKGGEASFDWRVGSGISLKSAASYTDGTYGNYFNAQAFTPNPSGGNTSFKLQNAKGLPFIRTPKYQASSTVSYEINTGSGDFDLNVTGSYLSAIRYDLLGNFRQPGYVVANANASWTSPDGRWRATVYGNNIFDKKYLASVLVSALATAVTYARPATYGARLEYLF